MPTSPLPPLPSPAAAAHTQTHQQHTHTHTHTAYRTHPHFGRRLNEFAELMAPLPCRATQTTIRSCGYTCCTGPMRWLSEWCCIPGCSMWSRHSSGRYRCKLVPVEPSFAHSSSTRTDRSALAFPGHCALCTQDVSCLQSMAFFNPPGHGGQGWCRYPTALPLLCLPSRSLTA